MGAVPYIFQLIILFTSCTAWAAETQLVHIHVDGVKIVGGIEVPNADYDIVAVTNRDEITALRFFGKNAWNQELNLNFEIVKVRGVKQDFAKSQLPGTPYAFSATVAQEFMPHKGGMVRLHALTGWKLFFIKSYAYTDVDMLIDFEAGAARASLVTGKGRMLTKISRITVNVGVTGASIKTE